MSDERSVLDAIRRAPCLANRASIRQEPIHLAFVNSDLTMDGEVRSYRRQEAALEAAARVPGVANIVDPTASATLNFPWAMAKCTTRSATPSSKR